MKLLLFIFPAILAFVKSKPSFYAEPIAFKTPSYAAPVELESIYSLAASEIVNTNSYDFETLAKSVVTFTPGEIRSRVIPILRYSMTNDNMGTYDMRVESADGTKMVENGQLKNLGDSQGPVNVKSGSYSFIGTDGETYTVNWTADELGFHASGAHLPTSSANAES